MVDFMPEQRGSDAGISSRFSSYPDLPLGNP